MPKWVPTASMKTDDEGLHVEVEWSGPHPLDRPNTGGWVFDVRHRALAERLTRAINSGKVFTNAEVVRDVNNHTYIQAEQTGFFHRRHLSKALTKIGF